MILSPLVLITLTNLQFCCAVFICGICYKYYFFSIIKINLIPYFGKLVEATPNIQCIWYIVSNLVLVMYRVEILFTWHETIITKSTKQNFYVIKLHSVYFKILKILFSGVVGYWRKSLDHCLFF